MTYKEAKAALDRYKDLGSVYGLENITRLMEALGRPEHAFDIIHVAGTNGKGSTVTTLSMICEAAGIHTASYTSPEVSTYLDRFRVGGVAASEAAFVTAFEEVETACQALGAPHPTIFEMELAIAVLIARQAGCQALVLETGLGGRLDATNVIESPSLVVFTAIGLDHMQFLGDTVLAIAREKAGIIKPGAPVVAYDNGDAINAVIEDAARITGVPCTIAGAEDCAVLQRDLDGQEITFGGQSYHYPLIGTHQVKNFALIMTAVQILRKIGWRISDSAVRSGLDAVRWPGRFEVVSKSPVIILDGAHNPQAAAALVDTVRTWFSGRKVHFLVHIFKDKDARGILKNLASVASSLTLTTVDTARSERPQALADIARDFLPENEISLEEDFDTAMQNALQHLAPDDILIICGSLSHLERARRDLSHYERMD